ncbi:MAG: prepilin-type N-terminal cleavage/methylation domain-containing protein [Cloacibacillus evryensis]
MDKLLKNKKKRAFTLVEILIVVIIIGILAGLMALSAGSSTETAEKTACRGDRRTIKSAYYVERAENGKTFKESLEKAMAQFTKVKNLSTADDSAFCLGVCHAGGTYSMTTTSNDRLLISCSIEGHDEEKMDRTKTIYEHVLAAYKEMASGVGGCRGAINGISGKLREALIFMTARKIKSKRYKGKSGSLLYASEMFMEPIAM